MPSITELWIYPIKSCRGVDVPFFLIGRRGPLYDRAFMVVDEQGMMLTQRSHPRMCLIGTSIVTGRNGSLLLINIPDTETVGVPLDGELDERDAEVVIWEEAVKAMDQGEEAAEAFSSFLGLRCRLVRMPGDFVRPTRKGEGEVGFADAFPILGISEASLNDLNWRMPVPLPMNRFRPNVVFGGTEPYAEDGWRRAMLRNGITLIGETLCARCAVPTTDQATGERGREPNTAFARYRSARHNIGAAWKLPYPNKVYFGRNFNVKGRGRIDVGAELTVLEYD